MEPIQYYMQLFFSNDIYIFSTGIKRARKELFPLSDEDDEDEHDYSIPVVGNTSDNNESNEEDQAKAGKKKGLYVQDIFSTDSIRIKESGWSRTYSPNLVIRKVLFLVFFLVHLN